MRLPTGSLVSVLLAAAVQEAIALPQAQAAPPTALSTLSGFVPSDPNSLRQLPGVGGAATPPPAAAAPDAVNIATAPPAAVATPPVAVAAPPAAIQAPPANNAAAGGLRSLTGFEAPTGALQAFPGLAGGVNTPPAAAAPPPPAVAAPPPPPAVIPPPDAVAPPAAAVTPPPALAAPPADIPGFNIIDDAFIASRSSVAQAAPSSPLVVDVGATTAAGFTPIAAEPTPAAGAPAVVDVGSGVGGFSTIVAGAPTPVVADATLALVTDTPAAVGTGGLVEGGLQPVSSFAPGNAPFANTTSLVLSSLQPLGTGNLAAPTPVGGLPADATDAAGLRPLPGAPSFDGGLQPIPGAATPDAGIPGGGDPNAVIPGADPNAVLPGSDPTAVLPSADPNAVIPDTGAATGTLRALPGAPDFGNGALSTPGALPAGTETGALAPGLAPTGAPGLAGNAGLAAAPSGLTTITTTDASGATVTSAVPLNAQATDGVTNANGAVTGSTASAAGMLRVGFSGLATVVAGAVGVLMVVM